MAKRLGKLKWLSYMHNQLRSKDITVLARSGWEAVDRLLAREIQVTREPNEPTWPVAATVIELEDWEIAELEPSFHLYHKEKQASLQGCGCSSKWPADSVGRELEW
ncbi:hypothetical protein N7513_013024 [Penicillium frequentans]|uniref:Uncharacterized protein n=1 Tax=Penicillium frequentans TaxID=3151616 RepID=A0AAD6D2X8_9EURO|nr:hypothetical protein N7513_013024 [Penicillium glabrum]KAJ5552555.1 hypothetical protein N7494_001933 [Penicillium glabrum]